MNLGLNILVDGSIIDIKNDGGVHIFMNTHYWHKSFYDKLLKYDTVEQAIAVWNNVNEQLKKGVK